MAGVVGNKFEALVSNEAWTTLPSDTQAQIRSKLAAADPRLSIFLFCESHSLTVRALQAFVNPAAPPAGVGKAEKRYQEFAQELAAVVPKVKWGEGSVFKQGEVVRLDSGFMGDETLGNSLWVHPNYCRLQRFITKKLQSDMRKHFHLVGTPGIGKTFFGYLWLLNEARLRHTVIFRTRSKHFLYFDFSKHTPVVYSDKPVDWDSNCWLIVDGESRPIDHIGPLLQCVSPKRAGYHEFSKDSGIVCYLETWKLDDLAQCNETLKKGIDDLSARFWICGGLPRYVLDKDMTYEELKRSTDEAVVFGAGNLKYMVEVALWQTGSHEAITNRLLHFDYPDTLEDNVDTRNIVFASEYVAQEAYNRFKILGIDVVLEFFDWAQGSPVLAGLSCMFIDRLVLKHFKRGGSFKTKSLEYETDAWGMKVKPQSWKSCHNWEIFDEGATLMFAKEQHDPIESFNGLQVRCLVTAIAKNQESWDFFETPDIIYKVCVTEHHPVAWAPLEKLISYLDGWHDSSQKARPKYYKLIYVVPESKFKAMSVQTFLNTEGQVYKNSLNEMGRLNQYVMEVPMKKSLKRPRDWKSIMERRWLST